MKEQDQLIKDMQAALEAPFVRIVNGKEWPDLKWKPEVSGKDKIGCIPYLDRAHYIERLNSVFTISGWQFEAVRETDGSRTGSLSVLVGKNWLTHMDTGTEKTATGQEKQSKEKAGTSDALKRCGTQLGIGTYLRKIPMVWVSAKLNSKNKLTPIDKKGRFLIGDSLHNYCNGMSSELGVLMSLLTINPKLYERPEIKALWAEFAKK